MGPSASPATCTQLPSSIRRDIDDDLETTNPSGAEDGYYLNLEKPYRVANTALRSVSELRLVRGFEDGEKFREIEPSLCAFESEGNNINVNTASAEVLKSLSPEITDDQVNAIIERRKEEAFNDINDFLAFQELGTIIKEKAGLAVSSTHFLLRTQARIGQANKVMYSIIYRDEKGLTRVIQRTQRTL